MTEAEGAEETLGPCGCTDYHWSDCPLRTDARDLRDPMDDYDPYEA